MLARIAQLQDQRALVACLDAMKADGDPASVPFHDVVLRLFERADRLEGGPYRTLWHRLHSTLSTFPGTPDCRLRAAVFANVVAVVALGDAEDFAATVGLARRIGHQRLARMQSEIDDQLRVGPGLPVATAATLELARSTHIEHTLRRAGRPAAEAGVVAERCYNAAFWLLMVDVDAADVAPLPESADDFRVVIEKQGVAEWRRLLATIASNPWGPEVTRLHELAVEADLPAPAQAIEWCAKVYRKRFEESERLEVAKEIRRLVAISGCSQRQFAQFVGTSPSRLSTYVNGLVTPSAAMMLRISRAAHALAQGMGSGGTQT